MIEKSVASIPTSTMAELLAGISLLFLVDGDIDSAGQINARIGVMFAVSSILSAMLRRDWHSAPGGSGPSTLWRSSGPSERPRRNRRQSRSREHGVRSRLGSFLATAGRLVASVGKVVDCRKIFSVELWIATRTRVQQHMCTLVCLYLFPDVSKRPLSRHWKAPRRCSEPMPLQYVCLTSRAGV